MQIKHSKDIDFDTSENQKLKKTHMSIIYLKEALRIIDRSFVVVNVGYIEDTFEVMLRTECKIYLCPLYRKTIPISPVIPLFLAMD